jgi:hypothetical protein
MALFLFPVRGYGVLAPSGNRGQKQELYTVKRFLAGTIVLFAAIAGADVVIHDHGTPSGGNYGPGWFSDYSTDSTPSNFAAIETADSFTLLPGHSTVTDVHWWGFYWEYQADEPSDPAIDDFTINFYESNFGPGALIESFTDFADVHREVSPYTYELDGIEYFYYSYWVDIDALELDPNTTYYLSIVNNTVRNDADWLWGVSSYPTAPNARFSTDGTTFSNWDLDVVDGLAFNLTGPDDVVPEPATILLLGLGVGSMVARRIRGKK